MDRPESGARPWRYCPADFAGFNFNNYLIVAVLRMKMRGFMFAPEYKNKNPEESGYYRHFALFFKNIM